MTRRRRQPDPWWSKWPAALALGLASLVMLLPWLLAMWIQWTLPFDDSSGLSFEVTGPSMTWRVIGAAAAVASLVLPVLTVRWARKRWLGYLLLGLGLSGVASVTGLVLLGVL